MIVVFRGCESADHRHTLESVQEMFDGPMPFGMAIDFKALRSRRQTAKYVTKTSEDHPTILFSGYERATPSTDLLDTRQEYYAMVEEVPHLLHAVQFIYGDDLPEDGRLIPLADGSDYDEVKAALDARSYVAMEYRDGDDPRIPGLLRSRYDPATFGFSLSLAHSDLAKAQQAGFAAVATSMWLNPGRYGEVQFWDGSAFHRSKDKEAFLRRFLPNIEAAGFDGDLVRRHDSKEMVRLAAWSLVGWARYLGSIRPPAADVSDTSDEDTTPEPAKRHLASVLAFPDGANHPAGKKGAQVAVQGPPRVTRRPAAPLPVFASTQEVVLDEDHDGTPSVSQRVLLQTTGETLRNCDTCHLAGVCPAFNPGHSCAFNFPVEVRTEAQVRALLASMVEMQAARVAFARFGEELKGGYPDPVVGMEMDRLMRLTDKVMKPNERRERLTLSVEAESSGGINGGVLSRIFGAQGAPQRPPELPTVNVIDAEDVTDS